MMSGQIPGLGPGQWTPDDYDRLEWMVNGSPVTDVVAARPGEIEVRERHWSTGELVLEPDGTARTQTIKGKIEVKHVGGTLQPKPDLCGTSSSKLPTAYDPAQAPNPPGPSPHSPYDPCPQPCPQCGGDCPPDWCQCCCLAVDERWAQVGYVPEFQHCYEVRDLRMIPSRRPRASQAQAFRPRLGRTPFKVRAFERALRVVCVHANKIVQEVLVPPGHLLGFPQGVQATVVIVVPLVPIDAEAVEAAAGTKLREAFAELRDALQKRVGMPAEWTAEWTTPSEEQLRRWRDRMSVRDMKRVPTHNFGLWWDPEAWPLSRQSVNAPGQSEEPSEDDQCR